MYFDQVLALCVPLCGDLPKRKNQSKKYRSERAAEVKNNYHIDVS